MNDRNWMFFEEESAEERKDLKNEQIIDALFGPDP